MSIKNNLKKRKTPLGNGNISHGERGNSNTCVILDLQVIIEKRGPFVVRSLTTPRVLSGGSVGMDVVSVTDGPFYCSQKLKVSYVSGER